MQFRPIAAGRVVSRWTPLSNPLYVQWSGAEITNTQPLWLFFLPTAALTLSGFVMAIAAPVNRDGRVTTGFRCAIHSVAVPWRCATPTKIPYPRGIHIASAASTGVKIANQGAWNARTQETTPRAMNGHTSLWTAR